MIVLTENEKGLKIVTVLVLKPFTIFKPTLGLESGLLKVVPQA